MPESSTDLYSTALEEFRNGRFEGAFASWQAMMARHADQYTIQVEIDRRLASVEKLFEQYGHWRLYVIVKDGQYWVFSGLFATQAEAERAVGVLPKPLREGGAFPIAVGAFVPVR